MRLTIKSFLFFLIGLSTTACYTISDFHEARVLDKKENTGGITTGYFVEPDAFIPFAVDGSIFYRHGLGHKSEMTYRVSWQFAFRTDFKRQIYESKNHQLAMATGINLEMAAFNRDGELGFIRPQVPFYLSYHPINALAFYGNVKYNLQIPDFDQRGVAQLISYNTGVRFGHKFGIMIEMSHSPEYNSILNAPPELVGASQIHGAIFFKF